jgi:hypothetical protein
MATFIEAVVLTALLGLACLFAGRLLAAVFAVRLLRRTGPESLLASAFLGTGFLMLAYGWGSYAGCPARVCLLLVALLLMGLVVLLAVRRRLGDVIRRPRRGAAGWLVLLALAAQAVVSLLPLAVGGCRFVDGDNALYYGPAEWLQQRGFGTTAPPDDPAQPIVWDVRTLHLMNHRMGPMFLLALVRAAVPGRMAVELYPAVMAWGAALNVAGVFLLARWGLRVPRFPAAAAVVAVAVACNSLTFSAAVGFFCQVYGTGLLAFGLALLSRLPAATRWRPGHAALLGAALAAQVSAYSEVGPVLALAALGTGGYALWRARRRRAVGAASRAAPNGSARLAGPTQQRSGSGSVGRLTRFAGLTAAAFALLANWEAVRAARGVLFMLGFNGVGCHIPWTAAHYVRFALGFYGSPGFLDLGMTALPRKDWVACALAGVVCLLGVGWAVRRRRGLPLALAGLALAGLATHFALLAHDPWTGETGHTWNLFKLCQWSFTLVAPLQVAGLMVMVRRMKWPRPAILTACAALAYFGLPTQWKQTRWVVHVVQAVSGPDARLADLRRLCRSVDDQAPRRIYVVSAPVTGWERWLPAFLLCPRPFANGWKGSRLFEEPGAAADRPDAFEPGTLFLQYGAPPFSEPIERLPFNYSIIDGTRPIIFRVDGAGGASEAVEVGAQPVAIFILSPRAGAAVLSFTAEAGPGRSLRLTDEAGTSLERTADAAPAARIVFPVTLTAGVNRLELRCVDPSPAPPLKATGMQIEER